MYVQLTCDIHVCAYLVTDVSQRTEKQGVHVSTYMVCVIVMNTVNFEGARGGRHICMH